MSNFISGQDLLTRLNILPFELFDHVKKGLQPFDEFGKPIPPPDISSKLKQLVEVNKELENLLRLCPKLPSSAEKTKELLEKDPRYVCYAIDEQKRLTPRREFLLNKIETLKKEIEQIEDKNSWGNYELPENKQSSEWVMDLLRRSYFSLKEVADTNTNIKKEFILGAGIRSRWNIDRKQFFNIINDAIDSKKREWILRPHNPRNYKQLTFAEGHAWPPCREVGGKIIKNYSPPEYESSLDKVIEYLDQYCYLLEDVKAVEKTNPGLGQKINGESESLTPEPAPNQRKTANYFKQNGEFWILRHEGKESMPIKHVDGLMYIAHLLSKPGTPISCKVLYQSVSGNMPNKIMSEGAAIGEGLNIWGSKQAFSDDKANEAYRRQWQELQDAIDNAEDSPEGEMVKKESNRKQDEIRPYLKKRTFVDPNDKKAQVNIKKRLDKAYETISKKNMKDMAKYLQNNIKPDGALGLIYTGSLTWEIIIE